MASKVDCGLCGAKIDPRGLTGHRGGKNCIKMQKARGFEPVDSVDEIDGVRDFENGPKDSTEVDDEGPNDSVDNSSDKHVSEGNQESESETMVGNEPEVLKLSEEDSDPNCPECDSEEIISSSEARSEFRNEYGGVPAEADKQLDNHDNVCVNCNSVFSSE